MGSETKRRVVRMAVAMCILAVAYLLASFLSSAQEEAGKDRLDAVRPEFYSLVEKNASIEKVAGDLLPNKTFRVSFGTFEHFTEGPVWDPQGLLLFSDIYGDKIYKWRPGSPPGVFRDNAGYPNGLTFDQQGRLIICDQKLRRVERVEEDGTITVLADGWDGKKLNCPNDVVVRRDGTIYFTDPYWKFPPGSVQELSFQGVFGITPEGKLFLAAKDFGLPNGIALSPDEKTLYIGDTAKRELVAFDVSADGLLSARRLLAQLRSKETGAVDGMKVDECGNIWTTGPGGIWVFNKSGAHLGTIRPPAIPGNCAWGDRVYRSLYMATPSAIYKIRTRVRGKATYHPCFR